ncbi:MAG: type II toxin-antitoxin system VapC family toxin [Chloroflexota bacterium]|nr:type II toxin-antitoxin system VapC family toxin [Chloroflexota bacterium]
MIQPAVLLDTDIVSWYLRGHPLAVQHGQGYLAAHKRFTFSSITQYEILRGLKARGAPTRLVAFEQFSAVGTILPIDDAIIRRAADIYADLYRRGELIADADTFIAATALVHGLVMVTNNEAHFRRITGLQVDNWLS